MKIKIPWLYFDNTPEKIHLEPVVAYPPDFDKPFPIETKPRQYLKPFQYCEAE
jgi:hypothetical protein